LPHASGQSEHLAPRPIADASPQNDGLTDRTLPWPNGLDLASE
jgi:hypothetical protein